MAGVCYLIHGVASATPGAASPNTLVLANGRSPAIWPSPWILRQTIAEVLSIELNPEAMEILFSAEASPANTTSRASATIGVGPARVRLAPF